MSFQLKEIVTLILLLKIVSLGMGYLAWKNEIQVL